MIVAISDMIPQLVIIFLLALSVIIDEAESLSIICADCVINFTSHL